MKKLLALLWPTKINSSDICSADFHTKMNHKCSLKKKMFTKDFIQVNS